MFDMTYQKRDTLGTSSKANLIQGIGYLRDEKPIREQRSQSEVGSNETLALSLPLEGGQAEVTLQSRQEAGTGQRRTSVKVIQVLQLQKRLNCCQRYQKEPRGGVRNALASSFCCLPTLCLLLTKSTQKAEGKGLWDISFLALYRHGWVQGIDP